MRKSGAVPMILAWISDDEALAKALFRIDIMIRPGATNCAKSTACGPAGRAPLVATTNTSM